jgi:hypothetical protein
MTTPDRLTDEQCARIAMTCPHRGESFATQDRDALIRSGYAAGAASVPRDEPPDLLLRVWDALDRARAAYIRDTGKPCPIVVDRSVAPKDAATAVAQPAAQDQSGISGDTKRNEPKATVRQSPPVSPATSPDPYADLLRRLDGYNPPDRTVDYQRQMSVDIHEAAAAIRALEAENARSLDDAAKFWEVALTSNSLAERAEADAKACREALRELVASRTAILSLHDDVPSAIARHDAAWEAARAVLGDAP